MKINKYSYSRRYDTYLCKSRIETYDFLMSLIIKNGYNYSIIGWEGDFNYLDSSLFYYMEHSKLGI
jgi:hypothetical protein